MSRLSCSASGESGNGASFGNVEDWSRQSILQNRSSIRAALDSVVGHFRVRNIGAQVGRHVTRSAIGLVWHDASCSSQRGKPGTSRDKTKLAPRPVRRDADRGNSCTTSPRLTSSCTCSAPALRTGWPHASRAVPCPRERSSERSRRDRRPAETDTGACPAAQSQHSPPGGTACKWRRGDRRRVWLD